MAHYSAIVVFYSLLLVVLQSAGHGACNFKCTPY
ncbi:hypothetical protein BVRB_5g105390 [Beta vulgaris subsp. vulgaris]|nr:hypothetical protein BVRB_5g105390 [Beta vulgaris subsp. vulgaris]